MYKFKMNLDQDSVYDNFTNMCDAVNGVSLGENVTPNKFSQETKLYEALTHTAFLNQFNVEYPDFNYDWMDFAKTSKDGFNKYSFFKKMEVFYDEENEGWYEDLVVGFNNNEVATWFRLKYPKVEVITNDE